MARPQQAARKVTAIRPETLPPNARFDIGPRQHPKRYVERAVPIQLSDGTVLSADVTRPADRHGKPVTEPLPAVITLTPYNKTLIGRASPLIDLVEAVGPLVMRLVPPSEGRAGGPEMVRGLAGGWLDAIRASRELVSRGYVHLMVDVRGTGTSTGTMQMLSEREQLDSLEVLAWVREQSWCNGDLAMHGISYMAITALQTASRRPDGLKAVFALVGSEDPGRDLVLTGGAQTVFTLAWLGAVNAMKWLPSVSGLIRSGAGPQYLRDRIASPATMIGAVAGVLVSDGHREHFYHDDAANRRARIENITAATWIHGGWHDVFDRSNPRLFNRLGMIGGAKQMVIDDAFHVNPGTGFGAPENPQRLNELQVAWFDRWVKGIDNGIDAYGPVTVRQLGSGEWVTRAEFPHPEADVMRWYLSSEPSGSGDHAAADGSLGPELSSAARRFAIPRGHWGVVSQSTTTMLMGTTSLLGRRWVDDDRAAESGAVVFTSAPLTSELLLSGPMNLHLRVVAAGTEAFWTVTVCDVAPDGRSAVLTRGALRSTRRAVDESGSVWVDGELLVAEHPFTADSILPVVPGVPHELDIDINATEALLPVGHRLRVAVARARWPRHLLTPAVTRNIKGQSVVLDPQHPSWLTFQAVAEAGVGAEAVG